MVIAKVGSPMMRAARAGAGAGAGRMLAWRVHAYGGAGELRLEEARVPPLRAPDELLVRVHAASLNPIDLAMLGGYGARALNAWRWAEGEADVEFPLVPGRDFAGTVLRAGPAARLRPGARVWGVLPPHRAGAHAQCVLARDAWAGPLPRALDALAGGGALYAALSACAALRAAALPDSGAGSGGSALLLGLGGVGQAALQLLVARGLEVTVGCSGALAGLATRLGAARVLDRRAHDYELRLRAGGPYTAVLDCAGAGGDEAARLGLRCGRYVTLSAPLLRRVDERGAGAGLLAAGAELLRQNARAPAPVRWAFFRARPADIALLHRLAERGQFSVCVERAWPWWRGDEAYARAAEGAARGKLLLDFTAPPP